MSFQLTETCRHSFYFIQRRWFLRTLRALSTTAVASNTSLLLKSSAPTYVEAEKPVSAESNTQRPLTTQHVEELLSFYKGRASAHRQSKYWSKIIQVYTDAQNLHIPPTRSTMLTAMAAFGRSGRFDDAAKLYSDLNLAGDSKDLLLHQTFLDACLHCGRIEAAGKVLQLIQRADDQETVVQSTWRFIDVCIKKNSMRRAIEAAKDLKHHVANLDPSNLEKTCELLWHGYAKLAVRHHGVGLDTKPYTVQAFLTEFAGKQQSALACMKEYPIEAWPQPPLVKEALHMEHILNQGRYRACVTRYQALITGDLQATAEKDTRIATLAAVASCATGNWTKCESILSKFKIDVSSSTLQRVMDGLVDAASGTPPITGAILLRSLQTMERVWGVRASSKTIVHLLRFIGNRGEIQDAYKLYRWVREDAKRHSSSAPVTTSSRAVDPAISLSLLKAALANGQMLIAERAFRDLLYHTSADGVRPPRLWLSNMMMNGYAVQYPTPNLPRVKRTYQRILQAGDDPDRVTFNTLIKTFIRCDNYSAAQKTFDMMLESGITPDNWTVNTIIQGWVAKQNWQQIERFMLKIRDCDATLELDTVTFNLLVQGFLRLNPNDAHATQHLARRKQWKELRQLEKQRHQDVYKIKSEVIWTILADATGLTQDDIHNAVQNSTHADGQECQRQPHTQHNTSKHKPFITYFKGAAPDAATYKLFMKAFNKAGDPVAASKLHHWFMRCHS
ncbi:uncharacterized protein BYT42DRAFT_551949 [Radiomyces spectabilis]|uniref:uncharacterized protein n=1 Tax=Radiomyces spectabilis TaxID=64574 RepID=UPI0022207321|nr:uncharacterized protein BYT42DRAFT_551949 [Radiomyces spectabilis]KAI8393703.1 hypothetical protein BYT42DRAFT_551949 [Radiomyces spectabilis]